MFKNKNSKDILGISLFVLAIIYFILLNYISLTKIGLWSDELFTLMMIKQPFNSMVQIGIHDVHPLGYYILLKIFKRICFTLNYTNIKVICTVFSLIPMFLLLILAGTKIKKNFGILVAGIFALTIITMPELMIFANEVRMYSWGLFFITSSFVYLYEIKQNPNFKNYFMLTIFSICSAHFHYFTALTSILIYLILFMDVYKNKQELKKWLISAICCILAYVPWIQYLIFQVTRVTSSYWIKPIDFSTIVSCIYYIFSPASKFITGEESTIVSPDILGTILLLIFIFLIIRSLKNPDKKTKFALKGFFIVICIPLIGIIISLIKTPIFFMRYMVPLLGILWLCFAILFEREFENKKIFYPILILILIIGLIGTVFFIDMTVHEYEKEFNKEHKVIDKIEDNSVLIVNKSAYRKVIGAYANNITFVYKRDADLNELINLTDFNSNKTYYLLSNQSDLSFEDNQIGIINKTKYDADYYIYTLKKN